MTYEKRDDIGAQFVRDGMKSMAERCTVNHDNDLCVCGHTFAQHRALTKFCTAENDDKRFCPCERFSPQEHGQTNLFHRGKARRLYCVNCHGDQRHFPVEGLWECEKCEWRRRP